MKENILKRSSGEDKNIREIPQRYEPCLIDEKLEDNEGKIYFKCREINWNILFVILTVR